MLQRNTPDRLHVRARVNTTRRLILLVVTCLSLASVANATDGVLEINQACAVHTGCFALDTPGFPVTINQPGVGRSFCVA